MATCMKMHFFLFWLRGEMQTICISVDLHTFSGPVCSKVRALWKATGRRAPPPICQMSIGGWRREYGISVMPTSKNIIGSCGWNLKHSSGSHARVFSGVGGLCALGWISFISHIVPDEPWVISGSLPVLQWWRAGQLWHDRPTRALRTLGPGRSTGPHPHPPWRAFKNPPSQGYHA